MRPSRLLRFAPTLALMLAGCGIEAAEETGTVAHQVVSRPGGAAETYVLVASGGELELLFPSRPAVRTGDRLRVRGRRLGAGEPLGPRGLPARMLVEGYEVVGEDVAMRAQPLVADPAVAPPARNILVVLFNFKNDDRQHYAKEQIQQRVLTDPDSVRAFYTEQSYGLIRLAGKQSPMGDVTGWHTLDAYNIPCDTNRWANMALESARKEGIDSGAYQHFIFYFPASPACDFGGLANIGGRFTWIAGSSISTIAHEFGHSFGLLHSNGLECRDKSLARVTMSDDCANVEYGNPFDLMGRGGLRHTNAYNKAVAGWLRGPNILAATTPGVYHIAPQEQPSNEPQLLVVPRDTITSYYLEYRQPFGFDNFAADGTVVNGLMVMLANNLRGRESPQSWLLDTTPATSSVMDAPLTVGRTFRDPDAPLSITLLRVGALGADIEVLMTPPDAGADAAPDAAVDSRGADPGSGCACNAGGRGGSAGGAALVLALLVFRRRRGLALLLALVGGGCGGGRPATSDAAPPVADAANSVPSDAPVDAATRAVLVVPGAPPDVVAVCNQEADVYCPKLEQCDPETFSDVYNDDAFCRARVVASCRASLVDPGRRITAQGYAACITDLRAQSCLDVYWGRRPVTCASPQGTLGVDAACAVTRDCQVGLACRVSEGARCGRCVTAVPAGSRCSVAPRECTAGTRCVRDECVADIALDQPCKRTLASCALGLACTDAGCAERTAAKGIDCTRADVCDPTKRLYCNLVTGLCDELPPPGAKENENCADYVEMGYQPRCLPGLYCQLNPGTTGGRCRKYALVDEGCDDARGPLCAPPTVCFRRSCRMPEIVFSTVVPRTTSSCP